MEIMDIMRNMDIEGDMRSFSTNDLNKQVGEVTDAAAKAPVLITRHRKPRFVMMSYEHYERMRQAIDPRRSYGAGETPDATAKLFAGALDRLAAGEGYDDEP
jgi:prevent-host-death family protein